MEGATTFPFSVKRLLVGSDVVTSPQRCIDFTNELARSLNLFGAGEMAQYFPQLVAATASLLIFIFFSKAYPRPKFLLAIISSLIVYAIVLWSFNLLTKNVFSYCF